MDDLAARAKALNRQSLWRVAKAAYAVFAVAFLAWALYETRASLLDWRAWLGMPGLYVFILTWMLMALVLGFAWARIIHSYFDLRLPARDWLPIQSAAWAGRYLPGKVGLLAGKLSLLQRDDVDWRVLAFSVPFEQFAFIVTGFAVAMVAPLPVDPVGIPWISGLDSISIALRIGVATLAILLFVMLARLLARRMPTPTAPGWRDWLLILGTYALAHAVVGTGLHLFLQGWVADAPQPDLGYVIGLLAFANLAGIAAVFAPAGIGVREAVIAGGLAPYLEFDQALGVAALLRVLTMTADLAFFVLAGGLSQIRHRQKAP